MHHLSQHCREALDFALAHFLNTTVFLILAAWLSAAIGAAIHYVWQHEAPEKSFRGFVRFALPKEIWLSRSSRMDVVFATLNHLTEPFTVAPIFFVTGGVSLATHAALSQLFGARPPGESIWWVSALMALVILVVQDFMVWWTHYMEHKVPVLWEIHKVHHSLPVMTPVSNRRHHPWQLAWEGGMTNLVAGLVLGSVCYAARLPMLENTLLGADAYFFASVLSFYQLRHSHIPLHYGRLEKWFLSPAQHQLHHSYEERDWDRNFSLLLSCWDRMFGTIRYVHTDPDYRYRIGLPEPYRADYDAVWKLFARPPMNIGRLALRWMRRRLPARGVAAPALPALPLADPAP